ncbi:CrcB family protein [Salipaludibacillus agaradhaerens]|uniref:fluoride efflux transporter FluC n=1 Tax=Salipaludibacillus agaradhaerens TaxID=76935 RepID=UPI002150F6E6|nr:CrcB family protein [Salipaludibacillus agaradhaerens]MCR6105303.1 CrcB family protein [Salipaludibacillus agaradhaerens]MCR6117344.1 CrcB family protein [Salipaludibacillus agaradhaerens]UJW56545.1 CrcB family protein [Bacillus sp. A116_S68]
MKQQLAILLSIFIGGVLGTLLRYAINLQTINLLFPLGTILENLLGSFLLGVLTGWVAVKAIPVAWKEGMGVGFCGGFTTMSTLAADAVFMSGERSFMAAAVYIIISLFGGVFLALVGLKAGEGVASRRQKAGDLL